MSYGNPQIGWSAGSDVAPTAPQPTPAQPSAFPSPAPALASAYLIPSGGDDSQAMVNALTNFAPFLAPRIVLSEGTFQWNVSVPAILANTPATIQGMGRGLTFVKLSAAAPRFLDCNRTADYQTFTQISIYDLTVDCNNVAGSHHVIFGNWRNAVGDQRVNLSKIDIQRVDTINVPVTGGQRMSIGICSQQPGANEATQNTITDITIRDVRMNGGSSGIVIFGRGNAAGVNVWIDRVLIENWYHSCYGATVPGSNIQLISFGIGGADLKIGKGYGEGSPDVGIEVDQCNRCVVEDVEIRDATGPAFYYTWFWNGQAAAGNTVSQLEAEIVYNRCLAKLLTVQPNAGTFKGTESNGIPVGHVKLNDCAFHWNQAAPPTGVTGLVMSYGTAGSGANALACHSISVDTFTATIEGWTFNSGSNGFATLMSFGTLAAVDGILPTVRLRNVRWVYSGIQAGAGQIITKCLYVNGNQAFMLDGFDIDYSMTNTGGGTLNAGLNGALNVGAATSPSISMFAQRINVQQIVGDTTPQYAVIGNTATLTPSPELKFADCDFTKGPAGATPFLYTATNNRAKVRYDNVRFPTYPRAAAAQSTTNFTTATFTSGTGNQYIGGSRATINFANGSGTGVTLIERSIDGGATYFQVHSQASGVLTDAINPTVNPGDFIRVTATTPPTCTCLFES